MMSRLPPALTESGQGYGGSTHSARREVAQFAGGVGPGALLPLPAPAGVR